MRKRIKTKRSVGKSRTIKAPNGLPMVQVGLTVTRQSGDVERYLLATLPNLLLAIEYRRKLIKVSVPKRVVSADLKRVA